jgi:hypothetical protein
MAVDYTLVSPHQRLTPFTGISETQREKSGIARAEAVYSSFGTWPATAAGDNRSIGFAFDLDPDYGYILMDASVAFFSALAGTMKMESVGFLEIGTDLGPGASDKERQYYPYVSHASRQDGTGTTAVGSIRADYNNSQYPCATATVGMIFNLMQKPTALLYPFPGVNSMELTSVFSEEATEELAQVYRFYMRFLQYDIVQGYNYAVNSPIMTR